jgi:hypothetical protein
MKPSTDPKLVEIQDQATTDVARQLLSEVGPQCAHTAPVAAICSLTADIGNKSARTGRCSIGI